MIKVDNIEVYGFEAAIRGMRNPMNSWSKSDSRKNDNGEYIIGTNDLDLMHRLFKAGTEHRKYLRFIHYSMDILAPLYWWKEFDTYKVGTTANSCSTMHKIAAKPLTIEDFSVEHLYTDELAQLTETIRFINGDIELYKESKNKEDWYNIIQQLPTSYNQKRTIDMNYEVTATIIKQRAGHKLDEWNNFIDILKDLPYIEDIIKCMPREKKFMDEADYSKEELTTILRDELEAVGISYNIGPGKSNYPLDLEDVNELKYET